MTKYPVPFSHAGPIVSSKRSGSSCEAAIVHTFIRYTAYHRYWTQQPVALKRYLRRFPTQKRAIGKRGRSRHKAVSVCRRHLVQAEVSSALELGGQIFMSNCSWSHSSSACTSIRSSPPFSL